LNLRVGGVILGVDSVSHPVDQNGKARRPSLGCVIHVIGVLIHRLNPRKRGVPD
jgi:hypothetical protein